MHPQASSSDVAPAGDDALLIPLSALQHYLYCPRQCALIHLEQQWAESAHTAEGRLLHTRTDQPGSTARKGVRVVSAFRLTHDELGLTGVADVVEFHADPEGVAERPFPVEYKRGHPKRHRADEVQLCAQALCLEAMLGRAVPQGALFYGQTRRRMQVLFDTELRELTLHTIEQTRQLLRAGLTPPARYQADKCDACSLIDLCAPRWCAQATPVRDWLLGELQD